MAAEPDGGAQPKFLILSEAYSHHESALRASLRAEYQVRDIRAEPVQELAEMVAWLPSGCALWRATGGPLAWSEETHMLNLIDYRLRVLVWQGSKDSQTGRNKPKPPESPKYAREHDRQDAEMERKAAAYRKRAGL